MESINLILAARYKQSGALALDFKEGSPYRFWIEVYQTFFIDRDSMKAYPITRERFERILRVESKSFFTNIEKRRD
jgi:hypothetical protein